MSAMEMDDRQRPGRRRIVARRDAVIVWVWIVLALVAWATAIQQFHRNDSLDEDLNKARLSLVYEEDVEKFSAIQPGMTRFQVEAIAGKPEVIIRDEERLKKLMDGYDTPRAEIENFALLFAGDEGLLCVVYFTHDATVASVFLAGS